MEAVTAARMATAPVPSSELVEELHAAQTAMMDAAVAGDLERVVRIAADAVGGPITILVPRWGAVTASAECSPVEVAAVRAWVEQRTRGRPAAVPAGVVAEVPIRLHNEVRGMVLLLQSDRRPRPEATAFLHAAATAALTMLAIDEASEETARQLRGSFLEDLRSRVDISGAEIVRRAARLRCDLSTGAVILCAELKGDRGRLVTMWISTGHPGAIAERLETVDGGPPARVYAALPAGVDDGSSAAALASARQLAARLEHHATVGLSTFRADPGELGDALREAELVLDVVLRSAAPISDDIASGTYKLLFRMVASHPEEVRSFYHATVAPLVHYDDQHQTELVATLQAYLDANCNMNATAAAIYAHRHTVAYRLERIRDLTGLDPTRSDDRERLGLGLKVKRIMGTGRSGGRG